MDNQQEDNLYPTSTEYFVPQAPKDQDEDAREQKAEVESSKAVLQDIVNYLTDRVAFYSSVDSIPEELHTDPVQFMHAVAANKLTKQNLAKELDEIRRIIRDHTPDK